MGDVISLASKKEQIKAEEEKKKAQEKARSVNEAVDMLKEIAKRAEERYRASLLKMEKDRKEHNKAVIREYQLKNTSKKE